MTGLAPSRNPGKPHRIPGDLAELFAVAKESGATTFDIARLFGLNPRTVREAISKVPEDSLRAIRRTISMRHFVKGHQILDAIQDELLRRAESGDFEKRDRKGRYLVSSAQLLTMAAIQTDKQPILAEDAGMSDPKSDGGSQSPLAALLATSAEMQDALRTLPEGVRAKLTVQAEVERSSSGAPSPPAGAVDASFEVSEDDSPPESKNAS